MCVYVCVCVRTHTYRTGRADFMRAEMVVWDLRLPLKREASGSWVTNDGPRPALDGCLCHLGAGAFEFLMLFRKAQEYEQWYERRATSLCSGIGFYSLS